MKGQSAMRKLRLNPYDLLHSYGVAVCVVIVVAVAALAIPACGKRYKSGTPAQAAMAYELQQGLQIVKDTQTKVIAAVDAKQTPPAIANYFLNPARDFAKLAQERIIPLLEQYDAAVQAGDQIKRDALHADLTPLIMQMNTLLGEAFNAKLPDNVAGNLATLLSKIQETIATVRATFIPV